MFLARTSICLRAFFTLMSSWPSFWMGPLKQIVQPSTALHPSKKSSVCSTVWVLVKYASWPLSCRDRLSYLKSLHWPSENLPSMTFMEGRTIVCVRRANRFIFRSSRLLTTVISLSRIIFNSFTDMSFYTTTRLGFISVSFCSSILSEWSSTSILVAKSGIMKCCEARPSSWPMSRRSKILGLMRVVYMRLLAILLLITIPLTY